MTAWYLQFHGACVLLRVRKLRSHFGLRVVPTSLGGQCSLIVPSAFGHVRIEVHVRSPCGAARLVYATTFAVGASKNFKNILRSHPRGYLPPCVFLSRFVADVLDQRWSRSQAGGIASATARASAIATARASSASASSSQTPMPGVYPTSRRASEKEVSLPPASCGSLSTLASAAAASAISRERTAFARRSGISTCT